MQMGSRALTLREAVLMILDLIPSTVHETAKVLGCSVPSVQPRFSELEDVGLIRDSGKRRKNAVSGKSAIVWEAV